MKILHVITILTVTISSSWAQSKDTSTEESTVVMEESNLKAKVNQIFSDILNDKKFDLLDDLYAKDGISYYGNGELKGLEKLKESIIKRSQVAPDLNYSVDEIIIKDNKAAVRWHASGQAIADFAGFKSGQHIDYWGISICNFKDGKITENWAASSIEDTVL